MHVGGLAERTRTERLRIVRQAARHTNEHAQALTQEKLLLWLGEIPTSSSRLTYYRALQAWHRWLLDAGHRIDDPTVRLPKPREPKRKPHPVSTVALERLLTSGIRRRTQAMVLLKCYSGLRVHEVAKVCGEDIDLDGGCIRVAGKGATVRWLPLHPVVRQLAADFPASGWWFPSYKYPDRPMRRDTASSTISRAMKRAGIHGTAHSIRHWHGTEVLAAGANLRVTQELMRHGSVASTQLYTEVTMDQMRAAVERLPVLGGHP